MRTEVLGELNGERTYATRRAIDQNLLPRPELAFVTKAL